jgi:diguanylate cyclase (GGDEF)-like protein/PAS domain S-box-containing protein
MDHVLFHICILGLLILLLATVSRARPDDRLRLWVAGWLCILLHFVPQLFAPSTPAGKQLQACVITDAVALGGLFFSWSCVVREAGRRRTAVLLTVLIVLTLPALTLAMLAPGKVWPLAMLLGVRQVTGILLVLQMRSRRPAFTTGVIGLATTVGAALTYALLHRAFDLIAITMLAEIFIVVAVDFWTEWKHTAGLRILCGGAVAWGLTYPAVYLAAHFGHPFSGDSEICQIAKLFAGMGMILIALEEDQRDARRYGEESRLMFDNNPHPLWVIDAQSLRILAANHAAYSKHGYTREEFLELRLPDIVDPSVLREILADVSSTEPQANLLSRHVRKDGGALPLEVTAQRAWFRGKDCRFVIGVDVREREALRQKVHEQSRKDILTGLGNRLRFEEQLRASIAQTLEAHEELVVACVDVARFQRINDIHGTQIGDEYLRHLAGVITSKLDGGHLIARTGGDEFTIAVMGPGSTVRADRLLRQLSAALREPLIIRGTPISTSITMGVAVCPGDGETVPALWRSVESALRQAKSIGNGQPLWLSPELRIASEERIELEQYVRSQLGGGSHGFHIAYQPIYGFDGEVHSLEALLRLDHPRLGAISPARVIPIAEETGLIVPLGLWVIEEVCRQSARWDAEGTRAVPIAINVSGAQFKDREYAARVHSILQRFAIRTDRITLEITESTVMLHLPGVTEQIRSLADRGILFAIDDFGTGYSSLERIDRLPLSSLKVDRSFIGRICQEDGTASIVGAIISMAEALDMPVVAEGVEREDQIGVLRDLGCTYLQGFLLARPVSPQEVPALTARKHPLLPVSQPVSPHHGKQRFRYSRRSLAIVP